jgi:hypothetical protein
MIAKKVPTVRIAYPKHWFLIGTLIYVVVTVLLFYLASSSVGDFSRWISTPILLM